MWWTICCRDWSFTRTSGCHSFVIRTKALFNLLRSPQIHFRLYSKLYPNSTVVCVLYNKMNRTPIFWFVWSPNTNVIILAFTWYPYKPLWYHCRPGDSRKCWSVALSFLRLMFLFSCSLETLWELRWLPESHKTPSFDLDWHITWMILCISARLTQINGWKEILYQCLLLKG